MTLLSASRNWGRSREYECEALGLDLALIRFVDWLGDCFRFGMIRVGVLFVVRCWLLVVGWCCCLQEFVCLFASCSGTW